MRYNFLRQFQVRQNAEFSKCTHEPFLKELIALTKIVALHAAALVLRFAPNLQERCMIFFAKSTLTFQFSHITSISLPFTSAFSSVW